MGDLSGPRRRPLPIPAVHHLGAGSGLGGALASGLELLGAPGRVRPLVFLRERRPMAGRGDDDRRALAPSGPVNGVRFSVASRMIGRKDVQVIVEAESDRVSLQ